MRSKPELNITPFVDIMLVLLAILMISATTITYKEDSVNLPKGSKTSPAKKASINVTIFKNGTILVNKKQYDYKSFIEQFNLNYGNYDKSSLIYISCDKDVKYEYFMEIYSSIVKIGFNQIGLLTK
jgi:biopolymer transport protein ExbD